MRVTIIGLGKQACEDHLPAVVESQNHELVAVVDSNHQKAQEVGEQYNVSAFTSVKDMLKQESPEMAIVAVPHNEYLKLIQKLAEKGVHIVKEKPFAVSLKEAQSIWECVRRNNVFLGITLQRRFNPIFQIFEQLKHRIGKIYSIEGRYTLSVPRLDEGWRARHLDAGGGALIDMGQESQKILKPQFSSKWKTVFLSITNQVSLKILKIHLQLTMGWNMHFCLIQAQVLCFPSWRE